MLLRVVLLALALLLHAGPVAARRQQPPPPQRQEPRTAEGFFARGVEHQQAGRLREAVEDYKRAAGLKPDFLPALANLGAAYAQLGRFAEAVETLHGASRKPDFFNGQMMLGTLSISLGRHAEAVEALRRAVQADPRDARAQFKLGEAYLLTGDGEGALRQYNVLRDLDPEVAAEFRKVIGK